MGGFSPRGTAMNVPSRPRGGEGSLGLLQQGLLPPQEPPQRRRAPPPRPRARGSNPCRTRGSAAITFARRKNAAPSRSSLRTAPSDASGCLSPVTGIHQNTDGRRNPAFPYQDFSRSDAPAELLLGDLGHHLR